MAVTRVVPSSSKVTDKVTREELNKVYNQFSSLLNKVQELEKTIAELKGN